MDEKIVKDSQCLAKDLVNDCISRKAAITQLSHNKNKGDDEWELAVQNDIQTIWKLPAAQPETHDKRAEMHACDLISRQALCEYALNQKDKNITANDIMRFPPAQPEVAKDTNVLTNDCISRQAVIDALENIDCSDGIGISALKCDVVEDAINAINALPPAQPERKRGKWIEDDDGWDEVIWRCSECDAVFTLIDGTPKENEYYFCPYCGADMREVDDERHD